MAYRKKIVVKSIIVAENIETAKNIAHALQIDWNGSHFENPEFVIIWLVDNILRYLAPEHHDSAWSGKWTMESLPMVPKKLLANPVGNTKEHYEKVSTILKRSDVGTLICATNPEGEGERIFRLLCRHVGIHKPFKRLWAHSMTPGAILDSYENLLPGETYDGLAANAFIKAETNWHFTMNMSRLISVLTHSNGVSINRQTPIMGMLANRQKLIDAYAPQTTFGVNIKCEYQGGEFVSSWYDAKAPDKSTVPDVFLAKQILKEVGSSGAVVSHVTRQKRVIPAPLLFNSAELQKAANQILNFPASKTMSVAKSLFEQHRIISFYNTDSQHLSKEIIKALPTILSALHPHYLDQVEGIFDRLKASPEITTKLLPSLDCYHHAIIPTEEQIILSDLNQAERGLYELICKRFIAAFMPPQVVLSSQAILTVGQHLFRAQGTKVISKGWASIDNKQDIAPLFLPFLEGEDKVTITELNIEENLGTPPTYYTEKELIGEVQQLEKTMGIGNTISREMYHSIDGWLHKNLIEQIGDSIILTDRGIAQIEALEQIAEHVKEAKILFSPKAMCFWEKEISTADFTEDEDVRVTYKMALAKTREFMCSIIDSCREHMDQLKLIRLHAPELGKCLECQATVIELPTGYKCSSKKKCSFFFPRKAFGTNIPSSEAKLLLAEGKTSPLRCFSSRTKKYYIASLTWSKDDKRLIPVFESNDFGECPACKKGKVVEMKRNFGCSAYKEENCGFYIGKFEGEDGFDQAAMKELLETRVTQKYYTFSKKDGKTYQAKLKLELDGNIKFRYKNRR